MSNDQTPIISEDGQWRWDGQRWVPNVQTPVTPLPKRKGNGKRNLGIGCASAVALIALISIVSAAASNGGSKPQASTASKPAATATATPKPAAPAVKPAATPAPTPKPATPAPTPNTAGKATMAKFQQVQSGMSLEQVNAIMGGPGELQVEDNVAGYSGAIYQWEGTEPIFPGIMTVQFQNGAVVTKAQSGLK